MNLYFFARKIVRGYFKLFFKWEVNGAGNVPNDGSVILVANHISNYDPLALGCAVERQVHFMAKEELFKIPLVGKIIYKFGAFPIKRGKSDRKAIKKGLEILNQGKILGIFPEGTRSKTGELGKGLPGATLFALKSEAVVVPVGIVSSYRMFAPIKINIGRPISLDNYKKDKISSDDLANATEFIMEQINVQIKELKEMKN
ncbi:acyl-phosphate glycerol 3-phosphate acyltransferase [Vulcanibacillus modesticaldus]|uniref:1-acyl-sn-glycerol-3-phosphate acyltransferase n=1 Tax=Vulcanibacillus modesticaldus TaxID=337097 RepID=A0A1D2YSI7_9BACI|nr:lysophospholipid acyltransferase family protein [Vulcanibacillus modesticaldus]OEF97281.1 acyl-phosphate glycerol 3-phosphate acyltransferase [Vulcanibacillus modesticaldus]